MCKMTLRSIQYKHELHSAVKSTVILPIHLWNNIYMGETCSIRPVGWLAEVWVLCSGGIQVRNHIQCEQWSSASNMMPCQRSWALDPSWATAVRECCWLAYFICCTKGEGRAVL